MPQLHKDVLSLIHSTRDALCPSSASITPAQASFSDQHPRKITSSVAESCCRNDSSIKPEPENDERADNCNYMIPIQAEAVNSTVPNRNHDIKTICYSDINSDLIGTECAEKQPKLMDIVVATECCGQIQDSSNLENSNMAHLEQSNPGVCHPGSSSGSLVAALQHSEEELHMPKRQNGSTSVSCSKFSGCQSSCDEVKGDLNVVQSPDDALLVYQTLFPVQEPSILQNPDFDILHEPHDLQVSTDAGGENRFTVDEISAGISMENLENLLSGQVADSFGDAAGNVVSCCHTTPTTTSITAEFVVLSDKHSVESSVHASNQYNG